LSSALSNSPSSAKPEFDLDYSIHDFEADPYPDSQYLYRRIEEAMISEGTLPGGRTLDVACGVGKIAIEIGKRDTRGFGLEPSNEMLGLSRYLFPKADAVFVRGVAESLPFADASFDRIICQGALDHFVSPDDFMREAARVVRPDGRVVIALANYESLSCKLGRGVHALAKRFFNRELYAHRPYYAIPLDHFHKGDLAFVRKLGGEELRLERTYGISLLWLLRAGERWSWGKTLARWPKPLASSAIVALDQIAYRTPLLADMIVSVWKPNR
jgi:SAM-dependent methyltransferase